MKVRCSFCPVGSPRTDYVKLITINGRDYIICLHCLERRTPNGHADIREDVSRVQA